jgi:hypothetical protein
MTVFENALAAARRTLEDASAAAARGEAVDLAGLDQLVAAACAAAASPPRPEGAAAALAGLLAPLDALSKTLEIRHELSLRQTAEARRAAASAYAGTGKP